MRYECDRRATIDYRQIILGFQIEEGRSSWPRHSEISDDLLAAIEHPKPVTIVDSVTAWSVHP